MAGLAPIGGGANVTRSVPPMCRSVVWAPIVPDAEVPELAGTSGPADAIAVLPVPSCATEGADDGPDAVGGATDPLAHPATPTSTDAPQTNSRAWHPALVITYLGCTSM